MVKLQGKLGGASTSYRVAARYVPTFIPQPVSGDVYFSGFDSADSQSATFNQTTNHISGLATSQLSAEPSLFLLARSGASQVQMQAKQRSNSPDTA